MPNDTADTRSPHPVDIHVGLRLRLRRKEKGMSQADLADALDLTFQQVQKYERGANRISASKLYEAAQAVKVPIEYFFRGLDEQSVLEASISENTVNAFLLTSEGLDLAQTFPRIKSAKLKRRILELVQTVARDDDDR